MRKRFLWISSSVRYPTRRAMVVSISITEPAPYHRRRRLSRMAGSLNSSGGVHGRNGRMCSDGVEVDWFVDGEADGVRMKWREIILYCYYEATCQ